MANRQDMRTAAQNLAKQVEDLLIPTIPVTEIPVTPVIELAPRLIWPGKGRKGPDLRCITYGNRDRQIALVSTQASEPDLAGQSTDFSAKEKEGIVQGLQRMAEVVHDLAAERKAAARAMLDRPEEREALDNLRAEYTIMQLEELKLDGIA